MSDNEKRPLSRSEKIKNYCIGIGALTGLILGLVAIYKDEANAEDAKSNGDAIWQTLKNQVDKQSTVINKQAEIIDKVSKRIVFIQAQQEGFNSGKLYSELMQAREEIAKLKTKGGRSQIREDLAVIKAKLSDEIKRRKLTKDRTDIMQQQAAPMPPPMKPLPKNPKRAK